MISSLKFYPLNFFETTKDYVQAQTLWWNFMFDRHETHETLITNLKTVVCENFEYHQR